MELGVTDDVMRACHVHPRITAECLLKESTLLRESVSSGAVQLHTACYVLDGGTIEWQGELQVEADQVN
jgi:hypothetical protein